MKKLSFILAILILLTAFPFVALADNVSDLKIVAFGDSLTHYGNIETGTYDEYGNLIYKNSYPEFLQELLGAEVYNAGVGGNTTDMGILRIQNEIINQNADVAVICLGMNDQAYAVNSKTVLTPIERYRINLENMAKTLQAAGIDVVFATPNPVCDETGYYKDGPEYTYNNGLLPVYCNAMREVAIKYGCGLVDINYEFDLLPAKGPYMGYGDGIHQNIEGRRFYAELVAEYINAVYGTASKSAMTVRCVDKNGKLLKEYTLTGASGAAVTVPSPELYGYTAVTADVKTTFVNGATHTFTYNCDLSALTDAVKEMDLSDANPIVAQGLTEQIETASSLLSATVLDFDAINNCMADINNLLDSLSSGELVLSLRAKYEASSFTYSNKIYADDGVRLTDGSKGAPSGASSLYAAWQSDATVIIDLGETTEADVFSGYFAGTTGWGVKNPTGMIVYYLADGGNWVKINGALEVKHVLTEANNENGTWSTDKITLKAPSAVKTNKIKFEIPRNAGFIWVDELEVALGVGKSSVSIPESDNLALYKPYTTSGIYSENGADVYPDENCDSLTDGVIASDDATYSDFAYVGFNRLAPEYVANGYASITVDLQKSYNLGKFVAYIASSFNAGAGIHPCEVEIFVSKNGSSWQSVGKANVEDSTEISAIGAVLELSEAVEARYIQYRLSNEKYNWIFACEVEAYEFTEKTEGGENGGEQETPDPDPTPDPTPDPKPEPKPEPTPDPEPDTDSEFMLGDVNDSKEIDSMDYVLVKRAYFGTFEFSEDQFARGDVNKSGDIDSMDYVLIKRAYFGTFSFQ